MFEIGQIYHRQQQIHDVYGGQRQGGISTPATAPFVFLFTGDTGEQYGYRCLRGVPVPRGGTTRSWSAFFGGLPQK